MLLNHNFTDKIFDEDLQNQVNVFGKNQIFRDNTSKLLNQWKKSF